MPVFAPAVGDEVVINSIRKRQKFGEDTAATAATAEPDVVTSSTVEEAPALDSFFETQDVFLFDLPPFLL